MLLDVEVIALTLARRADGRNRKVAAKTRYLGPIPGMAIHGAGVTGRLRIRNRPRNQLKETSATMGMVYHWSDRRSDFALDDRASAARRLRPLRKLTVWVAIVAAPWAVLGLLAWSLLNVFPLSG
jgi:hypothetical protein